MPKSGYDSVIAKLLWNDLQCWPGQGLLEDCTSIVEALFDGAFNVNMSNDHIVFESNELAVKIWW